MWCLDTVVGLGFYYGAWILLGVLNIVSGYNLKFITINKKLEGVHLVIEIV